MVEFENRFLRHSDGNICCACGCLFVAHLVQVTIKVKERQQPWLTQEEEGGVLQFINKFLKIVQHKYQRISPEGLKKIH